MAACVAAAGVLALARHGRLAPSADRTLGLIHVLAGRGLAATPDDVRWVDYPGHGVGLLGGPARAVVRATVHGEPADIYLVDTRLSPEGVLLRVGDDFNLTETNGADESAPVVRGSFVAYVARPLITEAAPTVHVIDLRGQPPPAADWSRLERAQNALTSYQQTGQLRGVGRRTFGVDPPPDQPEEKGSKGELSVDLDDDALIVHAEGRTGRVPLVATAPRAAADPGANPPPDLPSWIHGEAAEVARPGNLVTWGVDRVRAIPWIGDDAMQTIKAVAFTALDVVMSSKEKVTGDTGADGIAADLGRTELDPALRTIPVDPEIGWPPPPLEPWVIPALPGEGQWNPLDHDPYVRRIEGLPPAFLTTFIRSDRGRKATRVYVALWDPRQVELHMMAGTVEPKGATGEAGPGLIPRTPEVMKRVVAASNAGFQAMHGEFGMMADGVVYLPPKPYAATVAVLRDGSTGFGSWPESTAIPEAVLSYRQNMTVLVQDEKFNPYNRSWWGGTPPGWADKTHTVRTGICLTRESFVAYFYGADISPESLAQAMTQARCRFGLALDMNAGHSGLEFYKVAPAAELEPLKQIQPDWEAEGEVPGLDGWRFRGRRLIRGMGLMHFPRYIKREGRDFFYMTLRPVLPGPPLASVKPPLAGEGQWQLKGLPQQGFPYALALTTVRPDAARPEVRVRVLEVDPRTVSAVAGGGVGAGKKTVAILDAGEAPAAARGPEEVLSLWHSAGSFSIGGAAPVDGAVRLASASSAEAPVAAVGVNDEDGMLIYAELAHGAAGGGPAGPAPGAADGGHSLAGGGAGSAPAPAAPVGTKADGRMLDALLKGLGCGSRLLLAQRLSIALGGDTALDGSAVRAPSGAAAVRLVRSEAAGARRIFEDTPVVPFNTWYPLQQSRIRYFKRAPGQDEPAPVDEPN